MDTGVVPSALRPWRADRSLAHSDEARLGPIWCTPPLVVLLAVALNSVPLPVEIKFLLVFAAGVGVSFGLGRLATRWRLLARVV